LGEGKRAHFREGNEIENATIRTDASEDSTFADSTSCHGEDACATVRS